jgi:prepilin-type N-terminal cleavage/methylation domain-containing protein
MIMIQNSSKQSGFTLVEMAMAMIVIGLLIGIVIGGGKIRENAQVMDIIKQVTLFDNSAVKFREIYGELPGDIRDPTSKLTNCNAAPCNRAGDGDGILDVSLLSSDPFTTANERFTFWNHLLSAGLITGFDGTDVLAFGTGGLPSSDVGGGYIITYSPGVIFGSWPYSLGRSHHVITLNASIFPQSFGWNAVMKTVILSKVDQKIDDGLARWGKVQCGLTGTCSTLANTQSVYNIPESMTRMLYATKF